MNCSRKALLLLAGVPLTVSACVSLPSSNRVPAHCPPTVQTTVTADRNTVRISYEEPVKQMNGMPLNTLSHTTIYYDIGDGAVEYTKHIATSVHGGGQVKREILVPVDPGKTLNVRLCITASNSAGEGLPTP
jgi:hypothetical protein